MKKTLVACLAVAALFAVATSASAITCTVDQRPAATLLIPYFQATFNADGTVQGTGSTALDTLVTIGNASSAPMIAHVSVFSQRSEIVLDFNVALTGFDIQSWSMANLLRGALPSTPVSTSHAAPAVEVCQRKFDVSGVNPPIYPAAGGYIRVIPQDPVTPQDNHLATTIYAPAPFNTTFLFNVIDSLDQTSDSIACTGSVNQVIQNPISGYITIDHANYCNLSNPSDAQYYPKDAIGMENNLWGDYIYTSGGGQGSMGFPAVAIEADPSLFNVTAVGAGTVGTRTFYRRYVTAADALGCDPANTTWTAGNAALDCGAGDQREPLGLKYAARWADSGGAPGTNSFFNVWRASAGNLKDLLGSSCAAAVVEPVVTLTFYDEDENTVTSGSCPSPCTSPTFNFPLETQRTSISAFTHPAGTFGWVNMAFFNNSSAGNFFGVLDQAYVTYDFQGGANTFSSAGFQAAQLDPSTCNPLLVPTAPALGGVNVITPTIPLVVGTGN